MNRRKAYVWVIATVVCAIIVLCVSLVFVDNEKITERVAAADVASEPRRIVSLAPNLTEILFALGLGDRVVAVSSDSDYPPAALEKTKVGSFWQPNTEAIVASKPDLVITLWFREQRAVAESLERLGYEVLTLKLESVEELTEAIIKIGAATGAETKAKELAAKITAELQQITKRYRVQERPKLLWVLQTEPLRVAGIKTFINQLIEMAGGQNAIGPTLHQYPQVGTEILLTCGAQAIIHSAMSKESLKKQQEAAVEFWNKYPGLPAVKHQRIYVVDADTVLRLGPRLPQGLKLIASLLHDESPQTSEASE